MDNLHGYEPIIGLEIHIQLDTKSKAFSSDSASFGAMANTQLSVISLAHPGTLPKHNKAALDASLRLAIALKTNINRNNQYARKNYFYADLPKGYQISQYKTPFCTGGFVSIKLKDGTTKDIALTRIHWEEDSGKSMHDQDLHDTLIDYNRAGVPLVEMVTEPVIANSEEAYSFVSEVRKLVRYLNICDGNMEEGSLRCDANVSVRKKGTSAFGTKVEIKNMNSITNVKKAIDFEIKRQIELLENGNSFDSETRGFNALKNETYSMRSKEMVKDYRYFPEPDLPPIKVSDEWIASIKSTLPQLPVDVYNKLIIDYQLPEYDSVQISEDKLMADFFFEIAKYTKNYKSASNWLLGNIRAFLNENAIQLEQFVLSPAQIAEIIDLIDLGKISHTAASQHLFEYMCKNPNKSALHAAEEKNLIQNNDSNYIESLIDDVLNSMPLKVDEYKTGKIGLLGLFVGEVMKKSEGKADPKLTNELVRKKLA